MKTCFWYPLSFALIAVVFFVCAGTGFCDDKAPLFTNEDIDKYRNSSDNKPQEQRRTVILERKDESRRAGEKKEQEYWCKRASLVKKKIEKATRDVREREEEISGEQSSHIRISRKMNTLQSRLKKAKDNLTSAEKDLDDIEHEAHRKGIHPGWLRCQFD